MVRLRDRTSLFAASRKRGVIEILQTQSASLPIEVLHRKRASISSQPVCEFVVAENVCDAVGDFSRIAATQEEGIDAVAQT